tara:strand:+ start:291 stop:602 length:312 start_codon:yes stop_codon:yes gene_type:complete
VNCLGLFLALSMHVGLEGDYNNIHPHVRCTLDNSIAGVYYNSEDNISSYIGMKHNGFEIGLVTGYDYSKVVPMIRYKKDNWFISPAYEKGDNYGIVIGIEIGD